MECVLSGVLLAFSRFRRIYNVWVQYISPVVVISVRGILVILSGASDPVPWNLQAPRRKVYNLILSVYFDLVLCSKTAVE